MRKYFVVNPIQNMPGQNYKFYNFAQGLPQRLQGIERLEGYHGGFTLGVILEREGQPPEIKSEHILIFEEPRADIVGALREILNFNTTVIEEVNRAYVGNVLQTVRAALQKRQDALDNLEKALAK